MEQIQLPTITPFFTLKATLDGASYLLRFEWNMRCGWFIGLSDQDGVAIFSPKRMVPDWDFLQHETDPRRPRGALLVRDTSGLGEPAVFEDFGTRHILVYATEAEMDELR